MAKTFFKAEYHNGGMIERGNNWLETDYSLNTDLVLTTTTVYERDGEERTKSSTKRISEKRYRHILDFLRTDFFDTKVTVVSAIVISGK